MMRGAAMLVVLWFASQSSPAQAPAMPTAAEALHSAVRTGKADEVTRLLKNGVSVNARDGLGSTPLHDASWAGDAEMVHLLLENGADVNAHHSEGGSTPLHYAILTGRPSVVRMLLEAG